MAERSKSKVSDALRKALAAGVGAVFLTEEGIRNAVADVKLPKEALNFLAAQTDKTRKDIMRSVAKEVKKFLRSSDLERLLGEILKHFTVEIKAQIRFKTNDKGKLEVESVSED